MKYIFGLDVCLDNSGLFRAEMEFKELEPLFKSAKTRFK